MEVVNFFPGRVRYKSPYLYNNKALSRYINAYADHLPGVRYSKANHCTATLLVVYDTGKIDGNWLNQNIEDALIAFIKNKPAEPDPYEDYCNRIEKRDKARRKFIFFGLIYLIFKVKHSMYGKFFFSSHVGILKLASMATIIGGYPLIKGLYKKFARHIPADSDILLSLTALSFTLLRESSKGVLVLMLKALNDYIRLSADVESRRLLCQSAGKILNEPEAECKPDISLDTLEIKSLASGYQKKATSIALEAGTLHFLLKGSALNALSVLLVLSPSAAETALSSGIKSYIALLKKNGIYLRNPNTFAKIADVKHVVIDLPTLMTAESAIRADAFRLIGKLRERGLEISILTEDDGDEVHSPVSGLGSRNVYYNCTCEDKTRIVDDIKKQGTVMMIGGGESCAPAMKAADISVSLACSVCDKTRLHSDCILLEDDMIRVSDLISLSQKAYSRIKQGMAFVKAYNTVFGILAFISYFDTFTAKSINTMNSLFVLLLNKRIEYLAPEGKRTVGVQKGVIVG